ncbi:WxL domain-containing protein [Enterococcus faecalis]|nr:WxL domain-containing protein [Enterococcus faecalis]
MKRNKWQRLATIGLCSSLVINAFSGVTAVAETVTIESSPTAESSAKEETPASSVKEETTKASTENSQVTTDTSQEEATKEAEKQAETATSEAVQPNPLLAPTPVSGLGVRAGNLAALSPQFVELAASTDKLDPKTVSVPSAQLGIVFESEDNASLNMADFSLKTEMLYNRWGTNVQGPLTEAPLALVTTNTLVAENTKTANGFDIVLPSIDFVSVGYISEINALVLKDPEITIPKYIDSLKLKNLGIQRTIIPTVTGPRVTDATLEMSLSKEGDKYVVKQPLGETWNVSLKRGNYAAEFLSTNRPTDGYKSSIRFYTAMQDINLIAVHKKVTEKFVNTSGVAITPPTGFTQNKKTPMTSNDFTFKQAGTLPDTYTTGGKTYKFKGWYKGKTKPSTLTTTKAPSYQVTYDGNDDLNVVYEEADFPAVTYQFGFVNEAGQLVNPADIKITYDYKSIAFRGTGGTGSTVSFGTLATNQNGSTVGKLKEVTLPAANIARPAATGWNGNAFSNFSIKLPRYYQSLNLYDKTGKINPNYPLPAMTMINSTGANTDRTEATVIANLTLTQRMDKSYVPKETYSVTDPSVKYPTFLFRYIYSSNLVSGNLAYTTVGSPICYHLTQRKVTENFVDTNGAKITAPTGFTQGKQTAITSDPYTFKQAGTLPDTYTTGGKTYKFKGWYKGKTKTEPLKTTKAPSYGVTYDDNDDLNVVYEEVRAFDFPAETFQFGFVGEDGKLANPADINITYNHTGISFRRPAGVDPSVSYKTIAANQSGTTVGNFKQVIFPATTIERPTTTGWNGDVFSDFSIKLPKYYESLNLYDKTGKIGTNYPLPKLAIISTIAPDNVFTEAGLISNLTLTQREDRSYTPWEINVMIDSSVKYPNIMSRSINSLDESDGNIRYKTIEGPIYYHLTNRKVTENFVDANGTKITAPTGFTQGNQVPMTSNTFKYTAAKALPATYTTDGKTYTFQGWYKGKTKPSTLNKTTTPTFNATFDGNDDMTAMYKEEIPMASVTLTRPKEVIDTNTNVIWTTTITNTSKAPLQNLTLKKGPNWSVGLTIPTFMEVTPEGGTTKSIPVNSTLWTEGVPLPNAVPIGKKVSVAFTTRATGKPNTVLKAEVVVFGGIKDSAVDNFVRIRPNDQEVVTPTTEGFISVPTFDFGQVGVAGTKQQHSLKQAADYYGNGTRNPYVRIKKTQPNWSLTAQLSQPKSATDSLPTATRLLLGAAPVSSFTNYNQPTELKNAVGTTSAISLTANNTATSIIANKQFTGSNVYQLDFTFNNVKLEVPANQGVKGQQYKAAVTWNLVTGP